MDVYKFGWPCFIASSGLVGTTDERLLPPLPDFAFNASFDWLRTSPRLSREINQPLVPSSIVDALRSIGLQLPPDLVAFDTEPDLQNLINWSGLYPDPAEQLVVFEQPLPFAVFRLFTEQQASFEVLLYIDWKNICQILSSCKFFGSGNGGLIRRLPAPPKEPASDPGHTFVSAASFESFICRHHVEMSLNSEYADGHLSKDFSSKYLERLMSSRRTRST